MYDLKTLLEGEVDCTALIPFLIFLSDLGSWIVCPHKMWPISNSWIGLVKFEEIFWVDGHFPLYLRNNLSVKRLASNALLQRNSSSCLIMAVIFDCHSKIPFPGSENHCFESSAFPGSSCFLLARRGFKRRISVGIKHQLSLVLKAIYWPQWYRQQQ